MKGVTIMSYFISDNNEITLTRGDTLKCTIVLTDDESGEAYVPVEGDSIRFALKRDKMNSKKTNYSDEEPLIRKNIPIDSLFLQLDPEDTKSLPFGTYVYDIEITFTDGTVDTFITTKKFTLTPEVD